MSNGDRVRMRRFAGLAVVLAALSMLLSAGLFASSRQLAGENGQIAGRAALESLRTCIRLNVESAKDRLAALDETDARQRLRIVALSPLLDCKRSQLERRSVPLSAEQTNRYVATVLLGRFPIVNDGRVVGSRGSLLEGVDSLQEAGRRP